MVHRGPRSLSHAWGWANLVSLGLFPQVLNWILRAALPLTAHRAVEMWQTKPVWPNKASVAQVLSVKQPWARVKCFWSENRHRA